MAVALNFTSKWVQSVPFPDLVPPVIPIIIGFFIFGKFFSICICSIDIFNSKMLDKLYSDLIVSSFSFIALPSNSNNTLF